MSVCSISGEVPREPVVSVKSGHIFEKSLVEKHIKQTGRCPVTDEELNIEDLIAVKTSKSIHPRSPQTTSIPGLLATFQQEWDAIVLETFTLKKHLNAVREQLAKSLYRYDAARRVIARLTQERDTARKYVLALVQLILILQRSFQHSSQC